MQVWMVFGAVFCFRKIFGEILQKIGEISSRPSGNTAVNRTKNKICQALVFFRGPKVYFDNFLGNFLNMPSVVKC